MYPNNPWLPYRKYRPDAKARLFCFPFAGGTALAYRSFPEELPIFIDACAVQLPGREGRLNDKPIAEMTRLVPLIADALRPHLIPPFAFFGHSMGAMIAFELARELRRRNEPMPSHLFASACPPPHIPDTDRTHTLPDDQVVDRMRDLGGTSEELLMHRELLEMVLPVFRADAALTETYRYTEEEPLAVPITGFCGKADDHASRNDMAQWQRHTLGPFDLVMLPGNHFFLHVPLARATVMKTITSALL